MRWAGRALSIKVTDLGGLARPVHESSGVRGWAGADFRFSSPRVITESGYRAGGRTELRTLIGQHRACAPVSACDLSAWDLAACDLAVTAVG